MPDDKKETSSLLNKYQALVIEKDRLKAENKRLRTRLAALNLAEEEPGKGTKVTLTFPH